MPRTGLAYEKPSRVSQGLVVGFSIAVVVMAGWLVMMIMFSRDANTMAAGEADSQTTSAQPYVENISPEPTRLSSTARSSSAYPEPSPWAYTPNPAAPPAPPRSALPLASPAEPPPVIGAPGPAYTTLAVSAGVPDTNYRGILADESPRQIEAAIETTDVTPDVIPLPPPKPHRTASIPVPRPRPHLDAEDPQPSPDQSFFDLQINRQR